MVAHPGVGSVNTDFSRVSPNIVSIFGILSDCLGKLTANTSFIRVLLLMTSGATLEFYQRKNRLGS